jgi:putative ABC transport system permease protein
MLLTDTVRLAAGAVIAHRLRSSLTALGIAVGIAAVVLLTSIGEGVHRFVLSEFTQFGTNVMAVTPGRTSTHGGSPGMFGTDRPLTLDDAESLRRVAHVTATQGLVQGNAAVEFGKHSRRTSVYGVGSELPEIFKFAVETGTFLPADDPRSARAFAVLGSKVRDELFGPANPIGKPIRVGGYRFRVIGAMEPKGQVLGFDMDDTVYIPTAWALELFDREGVMEIDIVYAEDAPARAVEKEVERLLSARHGRRDFTVTTQQQMLDTLGSVLNILTVAIGGLGAISLVVGGVGIFTIMTIAVNERTGEIGLLRALGGRRRQVLVLFLGEAAVLAALGGLVGLLAGVGLARLLHAALPALPVHTPWTYVLLAEASAVTIGMAAGVWPARKAATMDPVEALHAE